MKIACVDIPRTAITFFALDLIIVGISSGFACLLAEYTSLNIWLVDQTGFRLAPVLGAYGAGIYSFAIISFVFVMGLYQRGYMHGKRLIKSGLVAGVLTWLLAGWPIAQTGMLSSELSTLDLLIRHITLFAILIMTRPLVCAFFEFFLKKRRVVLVGSDAMLLAMNSINNRVIPSDMVVVNNHRLNCLSERESLAETIRNLGLRKDIDEIVVDLSSSEVQSLENFEVGKSGSMRLVPKSAAIEHWARWSDTSETAPLLKDLPENSALQLIKYYGEKLIAIAGLIFVAPVMMVVALLIKLEDGGPVFYRQNRVGKNNIIFGVLKFRSMIQNAESDGKPQWAKIGDSRVTRIGNFIRKTRIDELPQLINIARGEMALVGPRPERPEIVQELAKHIPGYECRHLVRPGLTGWAQINIPYGADIESAAHKTEFDMYYIKNWSVWLDLAIIAQTIRVVLFAEGAR